MVQADAVYLPVWLFGPGEPVQYGYEVVARYPHDPDAFTRGLVRWGWGAMRAPACGGVIAATGRPDDGRGTTATDLADAYFGEDCRGGGTHHQLTWKAGVAFTYDRETFELLGEHAYPGEGWGVTYDGERLIMSDGTSRLRFWDPETLAEIGSVEVLDGEDPITYLNELEYVEGQVWANVWQTDRIARIDADSGRVVGWIDLTGLLRAEDRQGRRVDVLNSIAYDADAERCSSPANGGGVESGLCEADRSPGRRSLDALWSRMTAPHLRACIALSTQRGFYHVELPFRRSKIYYHG